MRVLVTGAAGVAGQLVCRELLADTSDGAWTVRGADVAPPRERIEGMEFVRCDTRTLDDARQAVAGCDAVIHLAAWHCAHNPPVSDPTIFAVNVDGTYNIFEAARAEGIRNIVFASSMAYGYGGVYGLTKVIGEDLWRGYAEIMRCPVALLRYHDFVPKSYLAFGQKLLRNGVDGRDVASATVASLNAANKRTFERSFMTIVHTAHGMPSEVVHDFRKHGPDWCETQVPGAMVLLEKYDLLGDLPERVEQHDLSEAERLLGWRPRVGYVEFLRDLKKRDASGEDVRNLWAPGILL